MLLPQSGDKIEREREREREKEREEQARKWYFAVLPTSGGCGKLQIAKKQTFKCFLNPVRKENA